MAPTQSREMAGSRRVLGSAFALAAIAAAAIAGLLSAELHGSRVAVRAAPAASGFDLVGHSGGPVRAVEMISETAWLGEGIGLTEVDLSDPEDPRQVWHLPLGERADVWGVRASGAYLLVAAADGLYAVDAGAPDGPRVVDHLPTAHPVRAVTPFELPDAAERYAIAVAPGSSAIVVRVSAAGELAVVGTVADSEAAAVAAAVDGTRAVLAAEELLVVDVSVPALPRIMARTTTQGPVRGVAARDGIAYVADAREGLLVLPMETPTLRLGRLPDVGAGALAPQGDLLYLLEEHVTGPNTVRLIDVADPAHPQDVLGGESTYAVLRGAQDLRVVGQTAAVAMGHAMYVADLRDVRWPSVLAEHAVTWPIVDVADAGGCVYAAQADQGLGAVDVRSPERPERWVTWRPDGGVSGVHVRGGSAFVSAGNGMHRIDVRVGCDPVPSEMPFADDWPATSWIDSCDGFLAATNTSRLHIARIGSEGPTETLVTVDYAALAGWPVDAVAQGVAIPDSEAAYVAAGAAGLAVVGLGDPARPAIARIIPMPEGATTISVAARGTLLVAGTTGGVLVYDARSRLDPQLVGAHAGAYSARALALTDAGDLYVAADLDGLLALDVSDPGRPYERGRWRPPYPVTDVVAGDRYLYAVASGLAVLSERPVVASPTPPVEPTGTVEPSPTPDPSGRGRVCFVPIVVQGAADWP